MSIHVYTQCTCIMVPSFVIVSLSHNRHRAVSSSTYLITNYSDLDTQDAFLSTHEPTPIIHRYSRGNHRHRAMTSTVASLETNSKETSSYDTETFESQ